MLRRVRAHLGGVEPVHGKTYLEEPAFRPQRVEQAGPRCAAEPVRRAAGLQGADLSKGRGQRLLCVVSMAALKRCDPALCVGRIDRHARRGARAPLLRGGELQRVAHGFSRAGSVHPQLAALQRQPLRQQRRQRGFFDIGQAERFRRRAAFLRRGRCARPRRRPEAEGNHGQTGQQAQRAQRQCNAPSIPLFHVQPPAQIAGRPRIPPAPEPNFFRHAGRSREIAQSNGNIHRPLSAEAGRGEESNHQFL